MRSFHHFFDVQIFYANVLILIDNFFRFFVAKILSLIADSFMNFCNYFPCFRLSCVPFFSFASFRCAFARTFSPFLKNRGICNLLSVGQSGKMLKTNINTNGFLLWELRGSTFTSQERVTSHSPEAFFLNVQVLTSPSMGRCILMRILPIFESLSSLPTRANPLCG